MPRTMNCHRCSDFVARPLMSSKSNPRRIIRTPGIAEEIISVVGSNQPKPAPVVQNRSRPEYSDIPDRQP